MLFFDDTTLTMYTGPRRAAGAAAAGGGGAGDCGAGCLCGCRACGLSCAVSLPITMKTWPVGGSGSCRGVGVRGGGGALMAMVLGAGGLPSGLLSRAFFICMHGGCIIYAVKEYLFECLINSQGIKCNLLTTNTL